MKYLLVIQIAIFLTILLVFISFLQLRLGLQYQVFMPAFHLVAVFLVLNSIVISAIALKKDRQSVIKRVSTVFLALLLLMFFPAMYVLSDV